MMEDVINLCHRCHLQGNKKQLRILQTNDNEAVLLCEREECVNLDASSLSDFTIERNSTDIPTAIQPPPSKMPNSTCRSAIAGISKSPTNGAHTATLDNAPLQDPSLLRDISKASLPQVIMWKNQNALCWLDACMCVLVTCHSLRNCLARLPGKSLMKKLCKVFDSAQCKPGISQDATVPKLKTNTSATSSKLNGNRRQSVKDSLMMSQHEHKNSSIDKLNRIRSEVFDKLKPLMKCTAGVNQSVVVALSLLLRLGGFVEEHFISRYHWELHCCNCSHVDVSINKKTIPTFCRVPLDFTLSNPVMLCSCPECGAHSQRSRLVFRSQPACVMIHFQDGLLNNDILKHSVVNLGTKQYFLRAVVQYHHNPKHFVTWIRDNNVNYWLEYDDLRESPFLWQPRHPRIPPREIHTVVLERVGSPCTACLTANSELTALHQSPVITSTTTGTPGGHRTTMAANSNSLSGLSTSAEGYNDAKRSAKMDKLITRNIAEKKQSKTLSNIVRIPKAGVESATNDLAKSNYDVTDGSAVKSLTRSCDGQPRKLNTSTMKGQPEVAEQPVHQDPRSQTLTNNKTHLPAKLQRTEKASSRNIITTSTSQYEEKFKLSAEVLRKIPEQIYSQSGTIRNTTQTRMSTSPNITETLQQIPEQILSSELDNKSFLQNTASMKRMSSKPKVIDSSQQAKPTGCRNAKFEPYSNKRSQRKPTQSLNTDHSTSSTLTLWKRRVGMFTSNISRKRSRRDSGDDTTDVPAAAPPPPLAKHLSSSVSSPSACSDVSSLSDNQAFASGHQDELTNTINELCKVFDDESESTPVVSSRLVRSRLVSPSQDMFWSELLNDDTVWTGIANAGTNIHYESRVSKEATLPSVDLLSPTYISTHMEMSPSCDQQIVSPVTMQQDAAPASNASKSHDLNVLLDSVSNALSSEECEDIDNITDSMIFEDVHDSTSENHWKDNLLELFVQ